MFEKEAEEIADKLVEKGCVAIAEDRARQDIQYAFRKGAEFGYNKCKDKLDTAIEIIEQMKDLFFSCWQERGYEAIKFEQNVNDFLKENK